MKHNMEVLSENQHQFLELKFRGGSAVRVSVGNKSKQTLEHTASEIVQLGCPYGRVICRPNVVISMIDQKVDSACVDCVVDSCPIYGGNDFPGDDNGPPDSGDREPRNPLPPSRSQSLEIEVPVST